MRALLDTSIVIATDVDVLEGELAISAVTVAELHFGIQIAAAMVQTGRQPRARSMDLLIAATAHAHSARLYTRNPDDFRGADKLVEIVAA